MQGWSFWITVIVMNNLTHSARQNRLKTFIFLAIQPDREQIPGRCRLQKILLTALRTVKNLPEKAKQSMKNTYLALLRKNISNIWGDFYFLFHFVPCKAVHLDICRKQPCLEHFAISKPCLPWFSN